MEKSDEYIGTHQGEKKGKELQGIGNPNRKVQARLARRIAGWEKDGRNGKQPGSQKW